MTIEQAEDKVIEATKAAEVALAAYTKLMKKQSSAEKRKAMNGKMNEVTRRVAAMKDALDAIAGGD